MRKRLIFLLCILTLACGSLAASRFAATVGTFGRPDAGSHALFGVSWALHPRIEIEANAAFQLTPAPFSNIHGTLYLQIPVASDLYRNDEKAVLYYNAYIGIGTFAEWEFSSSSITSYGVMMRIIPLSLGGPYYRTRERSAAFSLAYDLKTRSFGVYWNLFLFDYYL